MKELKIKVIDIIISVVYVYGIYEIIDWGIYLLKDYLNTIYINYNPHIMDYILCVMIFVCLIINLILWRLFGKMILKEHFEEEA
jgi:hypothetical protein